MKEFLEYIGAMIFNGLMVGLIFLLTGNMFTAFLLWIFVCGIMVEVENHIQCHKQQEIEKEQKFEMGVRHLRNRVIDILGPEFNWEFEKSIIPETKWQRKIGK